MKVIPQGGTNQQISGIHTVMGAGEWGLLFFLSLLWGGSFFFIGVAVRDLPPMVIVTLRVSLAALTLWCVVGAMRIPVPLSRASIMAFLGMGFLNNAIPFSLLVWGQSQIASGLASILNATTPFFTVIVAGVFLKDEKATRGKVLGVLIGLGGAVLIIGPGALEGLGNHIWGQLACVAAGVSYAFAGVFGRRFKTMGIPPILTATGQVTASSLMLIPITLWWERPWELAPPQAGTWGAILALGTVSTALAYIVYFRLLSRAGATNLLLVTLLIPVTAVWLGVVFLGEDLRGIHLAGMALIMVGLSTTDGRLWRYLGGKLGGGS